MPTVCVKTPLKGYNAKETRCVFAMQKAVPHAFCYTLRMVEDEEPILSHGCEMLSVFVLLLALTEICETKFGLESAIQSEAKGPELKAKLFAKYIPPVETSVLWI